MTDAEFDFVSALLKQRSGLTLTKDKIYLLETRLAPIARKHGLADLSALIAALRAGGAAALAADAVEAMTTNETLFFRDRHPFDALRDHVLPELIVERAPKAALRIWCAACSTGQEPYSLAMMLRESFPELAKWRVEILATDIAPAILERAREGTYSSFEVQRGLPVQLLVKCFDQQGDRWQLKPELRRMVNFQSFNLLDDPTRLGTFDIVLCRNVLIYFDQPTKSAVLERIANRLAPSGALLLGAAESIFGITAAFTAVSKLRGVYRKVTTDAQAPPPFELKRVAVGG